MVLVWKECISPYIGLYIHRRSRTPSLGIFHASFPEWQKIVLVGGFDRCTSVAYNIHRVCLVVPHAADKRMDGSLQNVSDIRFQPFQNGRLLQAGMWRPLA